MAISHIVGTNLGKAVQKSVSWRSGGQALPGLVVEKLMPNYAAKMLAKLPEGVVVITGTNGKTTTTKIVTELLQANGMKVLTNPTGSNMTRGIASGLIKEAKKSGRLPFDIAVLEIDEASVRRFVQKVQPRWVLALNVSRDQLDRFGEVDYIARLIKTALDKASEGVVINADDRHLVKLGKELENTKHIKYFAVDQSLAKFFPNDYELAAVDTKLTDKSYAPETAIEVKLTSFNETSATYEINGKKYEVEPKLNGQHNFQNIAAALSLVKQLIPNVEDPKLISGLKNISTPFGRGEIFNVNGTNVELVLVKNPASFRQGLASYMDTNSSLLIAINDNPADGRDMSWLWDVGFISLKNTENIITSGTRAADMALRLSYDDISTKSIEPDYKKALILLTKNKSGKKVIFATYTAMLGLYKHLKDIETKK